eukprot:CAMPEP_0177553900 /NCGR_PEP_ID=MMETSP0369-20130122/67680_1 /TAXON_ID=447022 ORGANISM="Scrippsiella hangoei-like, Strain SHHI-4" /NCGR_SAMPLE_ID=MMETSP0369 /ASSEMBLY_ACC=CAM_ASM_000364 /LENGTH=36 /DNA_ID= /DNA_START= /DNA_END= /DNA_ORIENTATION=
MTASRPHWWASDVDLNRAAAAWPFSLPGFTALWPSC